MKRLFTTIVLLTTIFSFSQDITGTWNGILEVQGQKMALVFHIENKDGKLTSTMDSPDQKAFGLPVESTNFADNTLTIQLPTFKIKYTGKPNATFSEIKGDFVQGAAIFPLKLDRKPIEKQEVIRPQTPKAPFPYKVEEVTFNNTKDNISLAGTLTYSNTSGKFPVVILITGSGAQDRNEELFNHKPFAVIADDLTKKGIAVLRYDDRGVGKSTGDFQSSSTEDFANDVRSAIEFLKTRPEIDQTKLGLIGHSEGGMIAPMVAANNAAVKFIVLMAGPGTLIDELLVEQSTRYSKLQGVDDATIATNTVIQKSTYAFIKNYKANDFEKDFSAFLKTEMSKLPENVKPQTEEDLNESVKNQVDAINTKWFLYFIKYNPAINLSKLKCGVLAINGSLDFQVPAKANLKAIENALKAAKNKNFKIVELAGLNHLFQEATTGSLDEYSTIEQTISPKALSTISDWILIQTK